MKAFSRFIVLLMLAGFVVSCSDDSLPVKFAEAFQKGDTLTCYKLYPDSRTFISFIDSNELNGLEGAEVEDYGGKIVEFSLNGINWRVDKEKHIIESTHGLVNVERVISNRISNKFYEKDQYYFEKWSQERYDVRRAEHINEFLQEFDYFWKVLNAIKNRDSNIIKNEIPDIHYFINRKFSDDFENASLSKDSICIDYDTYNYKIELKGFDYSEKSSNISYNVGPNIYQYGKICTTNLFDEAEYKKEFAALPIKIEEKPWNKSDNYKIRLIKYATEYIKVSQEYIEAVLAGNTDVANKLYPDGNFITSATIRKNIGKPISFADGLLYSSGCEFRFDALQNDAITIDRTYHLYDYSSYYSQYLSKDGATKLDFEYSSDSGIYEKIQDAVNNLSRAKDSEDLANQPQRSQNVNTGSQNVNTGGWEVDYAHDEFDELDYNCPYIYQIWEGKWNNRLDYKLGIKIANNHIMLTIVDDYSEPNLSGVKVTAQLNGQKVNIDYDEIMGSTVIINTEENYFRLIRALETEGTIKISLRRIDSFDSVHNYVFTLFGPTHVTSAMNKYLK